MPEVRNDVEIAARRPYGWWDQFADGQTHVFTQGVDFDKTPEAFRRNAFSWTARYNDSVDSGFLGLKTRVFTEDGTAKVALKWTRKVPASAA